MFLSDRDCWYRCDPQGNRDDIDAQFAPPIERLAFATTLQQECDLPEIHVRPLPVVVDALHSHDTWDALLANLPNILPGLNRLSTPTQTVLLANAMAWISHGR